MFFGFEGKTVDVDAISRGVAEVLERLDIVKVVAISALESIMTVKL
jgi:hypothetical protein